MDVGLAIAGGLCLALGIGHETVGLVWVLPTVTEKPMPATSLGSPAMTESMIRVTWHIVTIFAIFMGVVLTGLAWSSDVDPRALLLRSFGVMWLVATAMALVVVLRRGKFKNFLRAPLMPVPVSWVVVAVLCWSAA